MTTHKTTVVDDPPTPKPEPTTNHSMTRFAGFAIDAVMPVATVVLMIYFAVESKSFFTSGNLLAVATQNAPIFIVATVAGMLLMAGYVDLSVGSVMAVSGVAAGLTFNSSGVLAGIVVGIGVGVGVGILNGFLIGYLRLSPIVVTLGLLAAGRGVAQYLAPEGVYGFPDAVASFGAGSWLGIPHLVLVALAVALIGLAMMAALPFGRHVTAIGVNDRAAFLVGIPVRRIVIGLYIAVGAAAGLAGVLTVARLNSAPSGTLGAGFEIAVLTAVLLGGIPFTGGKGSVWRVLLGVWLVGVLANGITLLNIGPEVSGIITGSVLVIAAALEGLRYAIRRSGAGR